jgi:Uncharacterized alpha/beta hydrolase domain (DUF2235)
MREAREQAVSDGGLIDIIQPPVYHDLPDLREGKNIIVCADGTGNADVKGRGSNVFKLYEAVDTITHLYSRDIPRQIAFYHEGVGTESWWPERALDAATGIRLARYVRELYEEIARVYQPGDRVYLFGFSRGAFTVRTLAGLIDCCGIPDADRYATNEELDRAVKQCYRHFRRQPSQSRLEVQCHPRHGFTIEFVGVWDTVDAVGLPLPVADMINRWFKFKFDVRELHGSVRYGCQALALDEPRQSFSPVLWNDADNVEQIWFSGAHSDIGGGYPRQGLSIVALHWMMERAQARGLRFVPSDKLYYDQHQIAADMVHDPRTGLALYYRWKPRDVLRLCGKSHVDPFLHIGVLDRIAQGVDGYAPINIPADPPSEPPPAPPRLTFSFTERRDWEHLSPEKISRVFLTHAEKIWTARRSSETVLLIGTTSYWLFVLATIAVVAGGPMLVAGLFTAIRSGSGVTLTTWPAWTTMLGVVGLLIAWSLAKMADRRLDGTYSKLWHDVRPDLRQSLGRSSGSPVYDAETAAKMSGGVVTTTARISCP